MLLAAAAAAVGRSKGRAIATGQGLLPAGDPDRLKVLRRLQAQFALFDVRDEPSLHLIADSDGPTTYSGDDAWLGVGDYAVYDQESRAAQRAVVLCLQTDLMEDFAGGRGADGVVVAISQLVKSWNVSGRDLAVVAGIPGADRLIFDQLTDRLPGAVFVPFAELWNRGLPARAG